MNRLFAMFSAAGLPGAAYLAQRTVTYGFPPFLAPHTGSRAEARGQHRDNTVLLAREQP